MDTRKIDPQFLLSPFGVDHHDEEWSDHETDFSDFDDPVQSTGSSSEDEEYYYRQSPKPKPRPKKVKADARNAKDGGSCLKTVGIIVLIIVVVVVIAVLVLLERNQADVGKGIPIQWQLPRLSFSIFFRGGHQEELPNGSSTGVQCQ